ncbi:uncharacterized protein NDAI_0F03500 [Naumovozyma dairenensis CBS 421]|uniref:Uncharacterized protein n=1 Tax=Naumovozyma dairenensis (strain ATCC 10597 / BCRC 20456 / CBS 421 / NBRC 0211 / NRRL Y-12639) TaxID=1071378 RepID=G0WD07_NAUDC|nr:hypothetical protein NDAI_0F03500 [Naumovozyma dairenensis CBS 421]CCD25668.1 hypothetical protein NDAI_0F03500 [Naumovozyma dairenensis CBS 421]
MSYKRFVQFLHLFFLLGAGLLVFFLILSGARETGVLKHFYWFQATTYLMTDEGNMTRWYNYRYCSLSWFANQPINCSPSAAATPFSPLDNFGSTRYIPSSFVDHRDTYYYLSRVGWAMLLISLFLIISTIILSIVRLFMMRDRIVSRMTVVFHWLSFFFILLTACLYTGCYAKAKNVFNNAGRAARLGPNNFGFLWTSVFLLLLTSYLASILSSSALDDVWAVNVVKKNPENGQLSSKWRFFGRKNNRNKDKDLENFHDDDYTSIDGETAAGTASGNVILSNSNQANDNEPNSNVQVQKEVTNVEGNNLISIPEQQILSTPGYAYPVEEEEEVDDVIITDPRSIRSDNSNTKVTTTY